MVAGPTATGRSWPTRVVAAIALATPAAAGAQTTAPSSIAPPVLRPAPSDNDSAVKLGESAGLTPPANAQNLSVTLDSIAVEGGFPEVAEETAAIVARLVRHPVSVADLYAGASAIEAAHARHGFILARVVVPEQRLAPGGTFQIVVIDGFFENADVSGLPRRVRGPVAARLAPLVGERHLPIGAIEQPLLLAGNVPGLALTSTLARGTQPGGARLVLAGHHRLVSGSVSADNDLADALGSYQLTAQLALNSALGLGEQIYGVAVSGYDVPRSFRGDGPVLVYGGGVVLGIGTGRLTLNPEVTFARTRPASQAGVPDTLGRLRRLSLRASFVLTKSRQRSIALTGVVEQIDESNDAIDFKLRLSLDRYMVARVGVSYSGTLFVKNDVSVALQVSQGLGGLGALDPTALPGATSPSRQGASLDFTRVTSVLRLTRPIGRAVQLGLLVRGQTSLNQPVFRAEQVGLEGRDALSAYVSGAAPVDSAIVGRFEVSRPVTLSVVRLGPYAFAAAGKGWVARATAVEPGSLEAYNLGAGLHGAIAHTPIGFSVEYARGWSPVARLDQVDRVSASLSLAF